MFTGIVEALGTVESIEQSGSNTTFWIASPISSELKVDQSIAHSGVCLTVEEVIDNKHRVTAINETIKKTNLETWQSGTMVNLERCLAINGRLDGHMGVGRRRENRGREMRAGRGRSRPGEGVSAIEKWRE